jgi:hypothetical protein
VAHVTAQRTIHGLSLAKRQKPVQTYNCEQVPGILAFFITLPEGWRRAKFTMPRHPGPERSSLG